MSPGFAPAKINLFLHVGPLGADGYHPLQSWMVFADVGDELELTDSGFEVTGPFAEGVPADASNLAIRARDAFVAVSGGEGPGLRLHKNLPPASGIGGGSSDAAAVLRLLQERAPIAQERLAAIALSLGADVPACLQARSLIAGGRGEVFSPAPRTPPLPAVLVNPGVAVSTADVFRAFDAASPPAFTAWQGRDVGEVAAAITLAAAAANHLQPPAEALCPAVSDVLAALNDDPRCRLARMSGSGATCFALCASGSDARGLAADFAAAHSAWWVRHAALS